MADPVLIQYLTNQYNAMIDRRYEPADATGSVDGSEDDLGDVGNLNLIIDAAELFQTIEPALESSDFFQMVVAGQQGSGKSVLVRELAHHAHLKGYKTIYSSGFDLVNAPEKFKDMAGGAKKVCVVLDDMSYVMGALSSKQQSKTKNWFGLIRHALEGSQVLLIPIVHTVTALPPIFKNTNVWVFSKPTMLEYDYMVKIIGRNQNARKQLDKMFKSVVDIQSTATKTKDVPLNLYGRNYVFRWGDKSDPGDGRLLLLLMNGETFVYNSTNTFCDECKLVAFGVKVNSEDYVVKRPSEENNDGGQQGNE